MNYESEGLQNGSVRSILFFNIQEEPMKLRTYVLDLNKYLAHTGSQESFKWFTGPYTSNYG